MDFLREATAPGRHIHVAEMARAIGVHRKTLKKQLDEQDIDLSYSNLSDDELDAIVQEYRQTKPASGIRYLDGHLRTLGHKVQEARIKASVKRVDPLGPILHSQTTISRGEYKVPRPNALWHIDGHHKLIRYGIVIHGIVDGYCRTVGFNMITVIILTLMQMVSLQANTNNEASTVLSVFEKAVEAHGLPSRVRGDRGRENTEVSVRMIMTRGLQRASFMWGSYVFEFLEVASANNLNILSFRSTRNTRIERIWVEIGRQFARQWRAFFYRLEQRHHLQVRNPQHLWLLQYLFMSKINEDCLKFQNEWNAHPISGMGHNKSPDVTLFYFCLYVLTFHVMIHRTCVSWV